MKRIKYLVAFFILLIIEILIALYVHDSFVRPYVGDMLVVIVLYCFAKFIVLDKFKHLPLLIFIFAVIVELMQYFNVVNLLGLENNCFFRVLIGQVFDIKDIMCYGVGTIIIILFETICKNIIYER